VARDRRQLGNDRDTFGPRESANNVERATHRESRSAVRLDWRLPLIGSRYRIWIKANGGSTYLSVAARNEFDGIRRRRSQEHLAKSIPVLPTSFGLTITAMLSPAIVPLEFLGVRLLEDRMLLQNAGPATPVDLSRQ
jgi:hypothetical protein